MSDVLRLVRQACNQRACVNRCRRSQCGTREEIIMRVYLSCSDYQTEYECGGLGGCGNCEYAIVKKE